MCPRLCVQVHEYTCVHRYTETVSTTSGWGTSDIPLGINPKEEKGLTTDSSCAPHSIWRAQYFFKKWGVNQGLCTLWVPLERLREILGELEIHSHWISILWGEKKQLKTLVLLFCEGPAPLAGKPCQSQQPPFELWRVAITLHREASHRSSRMSSQKPYLFPIFWFPLLTVMLR